MRRAERRGGGEVIDRLGDDPREIDRVHAGQAHAVAERMIVEQALQDRLAVVEGALDGERMHIVGAGRGHHAALHLGDAPAREQHEQIDLARPAEGLHRRPAGVARGRHHDGRALAPHRQTMVHQPREQLHGEVLEGERRTVEQLEDEGVRRKLHERRHRGMAEPVIGLARHAGEIARRRRAADERPDHVAGEFRIGAAGEGGDGRGVESRPGLGHIEAAVAGEPGEGDVEKALRRGFAPGGDVVQAPVCPRAAVLLRRSAVLVRPARGLRPVF